MGVTLPRTWNANVSPWVARTGGRHRRSRDPPSASPLPRSTRMAAGTSARSAGPPRPRPTGAPGATKPSRRASRTLLPGLPTSTTAKTSAGTGTRPVGTSAAGADHPDRARLRTTEKSRSRSGPPPALCLPKCRHLRAAGLERQARGAGLGRPTDRPSQHPARNGRPAQEWLATTHEPPTGVTPCARIGLRQGGSLWPSTAQGAAGPILWVA